MAEFRRVREQSEVDAVAALAREIWTQHFVPIIGQAQVEYMLEHVQGANAIAGQIASGYEYYIVVDGGKQVGYLALVPQPADGAVQLSKLYLLEKCRGRGLGKEMLAFAEQRCRELGAGTLWLTVNKYNAGPIAFYERMGFENVGAIVADIGGGFVMDDYRMKKILTQRR